MKICISSTGPTLNASLDPRFGRAIYFLIIDNKGKLVKAIKNTGVQAMRGAGISAAQIVANEKINIVITGNVGPNAFMVLNTSGIKIFIGRSGMKAKDVLKEYQNGNLQEITEAISCGPGFGRGQGQSRGRGRGQRRA